MKRAVLVFAISLILAACTAETEPGQVVTRQIEVTRIVTEIIEVEVTRLVETEKVVTRPVEVTRIVVSTPTAESATETPDEGTANEGEEVDLTRQFAVNYLGTAETGGLQIELARVLFADKDLYFTEEEQPDVYANADVVGYIILRITNTSDQTLTPDAFYDGSVLINGIQYNLNDVSWYAFGTSLDDEIFPGSTAIGAVWFPVNNFDVPEITSFTYISGEPYDSEYDEVGPRVTISVDLTEHVWEPLPEELR